MGHTLGSLAQQFSLTCVGDPGTVIQGVCSLSPGRPGYLGFLSNPKKSRELATTRASAVLLVESAAKTYAGNALITAEPQMAFVRIARLFDPDSVFNPGIHASAVVSASATLAAGVHVAAGSVIEDDVRIGAGAYIGPQCLVARGVTLGAGTRLDAHVTILYGVTIGERCRFLPGAVIGSRGFGNAPTPQGWEAIPQMGSVVIGNDVEVGANTTIDRGALDDTVIGNGVKLDNLIQIAHNVHIGDHTAIAACVGIAGSARIGKRCIIAGAAVINGHVELGDDVVVQGMSMVTKSLAGPGQYASGSPAGPVRDWRRQTARIRRLPQMLERLEALEEKMGIKTKPSGDSGEPDDV